MPENASEKTSQQHVVYCAVNKNFMSAQLTSITTALVTATADMRHRIDVFKTNRLKNYTCSKDFASTDVRLKDVLVFLCFACSHLPNGSINRMTYDILWKMHGSVGSNFFAPSSVWVVLRWPC